MPEYFEPLGDASFDDGSSLAAPADGQARIERLNVAVRQFVGDDPEPDAVIARTLANIASQSFVAGLARALRDASDFAMFKAMAGALIGNADTHRAIAWDGLKLKLQTVWRHGDNVVPGPGSRIEDGETSIPPLIREFNDKYFMVFEGGKAVVMQETVDQQTHRPVLRTMMPTAFRDFYSSITYDDAGKPTTAAAYWLGHAHRRTYDAVYYDPSKPPGEIVNDQSTPSEHRSYNLWKGFRVEPAPGDWSLLRNHLKTIICNDDEDLFNYVLCWSARLVQRPAATGEVALVMQGDEGVGKGTFVQYLLDIFGEHGTHISTSRGLTGQFNGHLRACRLLFADEAFFAGDRQNLGALKAIITEPTIMIEQKFMAAVEMPNRMAVVMASNEEWVVPASITARRFCVTKVSSAMRGNFAYFQAIRDQMRMGGTAAMLQELLTHDISAFNVRNVPQTEALRHQRALSLRGVMAWWKDCLYQGYVFESTRGCRETFSKWFTVVSTELLFASFTIWSRRHGESHLMHRTQFGKALRDLGLIAGQGRRLIVGEKTLRGVGVVDVADRAFSYHTGDLRTARQVFNEVTSLDVEWPDIDEEALGVPGNRDAVELANEPGTPDGEVDDDIPF